MTKDHIKPLCIWVTGLSASDKTNLAKTLQINLKELGIPSVHLDGKEVRKLISADLKFSKENCIETTKQIVNIGKYFI